MCLVCLNGGLIFDCSSSASACIIGVVARFQLCQTLSHALIGVVPHATRRNENASVKASCVTLHFAKRNGYERIEYARAFYLLLSALLPCICWHISNAMTDLISPTQMGMFATTVCSCHPCLLSPRQILQQVPLWLCI